MRGELGNDVRHGEGDDDLHLARLVAALVEYVDHVAKAAEVLRLAVDPGDQEVNLVDAKDVAFAADIADRPLLSIPQLAAMVDPMVVELPAVDEEGVAVGRRPSGN